MSSLSYGTESLTEMFMLWSLPIEFYINAKWGSKSVFENHAYVLKVIEVENGFQFSSFFISGVYLCIKQRLLVFHSEIESQFPMSIVVRIFSLLCRKISSLRQNLDLIICYKIKTSTCFALRSAHGFLLVFFSVNYNISAPQTPTNKRINRCISLENLALC